MKKDPGLTHNCDTRESTSGLEHICKIREKSLQYSLRKLS